MMYREIRPRPAYAETIECFWESRDSDRVHRVMPDGCADILFTMDGGRASLTVVGPMTRFEDFRLSAGGVLTGARFRPGMWTANLRVSGHQLTDVRPPLDGFWGQRAAHLAERLADARSIEDRARLLEGAIRPAATDPLQRALQALERSRGCVEMDELASWCGISTRQLRRRCLERTGLTPKLLARILRFRHAFEGLPGDRRDFAQFALECGFYDQAHLINEFRAFAGRTPMAVFSNREGVVVA